MYKPLILSILFTTACLFSQAGFASNSFSDFSARSGRGGEARRGKSGISSRAKASKTRIRSGVNNFQSTAPATGQTDSSSFQTEQVTNTPYSNLQCVNAMATCLSADNLCGDGMFGCYGKFADANALMNSSEGNMCADVLTKCQCYYNSSPANANVDCASVWDQLLTQIDNSLYDLGECQSKFMSCAKKECGGDDYRGCVDLIDTVINDGSSDDTIDGKDFLRNWLNSETSAGTTVLSSKLGTLLLSRVASCNDTVFSRCDGSLVLHGTGAHTISGNSDVLRIITAFFQDFARKAEEGLIAYQETHAKTKWLDAERCVDTVDICMKPHCGNGYEKCLHEDGTVDAVSATNFKSYCQKDLIGCSEIRVEVGLPGYQFLQNPGVDGVKAVWNEWLSKKLLAHGNTMATKQRERERKHDKLVARAQRECEIAGGSFGYKQALLQNYNKKFTSETDDYKGDGGVISQNLGQDGDNDGIPDTFGITDTTGNNSGLKSERFYDRATCDFSIVLQKASGILDKSNGIIGVPKPISFRQIGVKCDETLFPQALEVEKNTAGAVLGAVGGGLIGILAGKSISGAEKEKTNSLIGGGVGAVGGIAGGIALQKQMLKKKISCSIAVPNTPNAPGVSTYKHIPVAKFGQIITLPQQQKLKSAFDALDNSDVMVQRGEYYNP